MNARNFKEQFLSEIDSEVIILHRFEICTKQVITNFKDLNNDLIDFDMFIHYNHPCNFEDRLILLI
jgi:hypothetical protein